MDFIEQCRHFLDFINDNPLFFLKCFYLGLQQTGIFLVFERYPAQEQVYPAGIREYSLKPCTLPGSTRSKQKKRFIWIFEVSCIHMSTNLP